MAKSPRVPRFIVDIGKRFANRFKVKSRRNALSEEAKKLKKLQTENKIEDANRYEAAMKAGKKLSELTVEFGKKVFETVDYCLANEVNIVKHLSAEGGAIESYSKKMNGEFPKDGSKIEITTESKTELEGIFQRIIGLLTKYDGAKGKVEGIRDKVFNEIICIQI